MNRINLLAEFSWKDQENSFTTSLELTAVLIKNWYSSFKNIPSKKSLTYHLKM